MPPSGRVLTHFPAKTKEFEIIGVFSKENNSLAFK